MGIIISEDGKNAKKLEQAGFSEEFSLQEYIYNNPECIPLDEISEDIKLLVLAKEFPTDSGPIDALGVDARGDIYLIETKLYKNPDKRLVIAQVLDYGASLWKHYNDFTDFKEWISNYMESNHATSLADKLIDFFGFDEERLEQAYQNMRANLKDGNFKFVVLMDHLHDKLKDLIVYLNQNSQFDVYAVELEHYKHDNMEILIPKLFGARVGAKAVKSALAKKQWDEASFFSKLKEEHPDCFEPTQKIYSWAKDNLPLFWWGRGPIQGSCYPYYQQDGIDYSLFSLWTYGRISFELGNLRLKPPFNNDDLRLAFVEKLKTIESASLPVDAENRFPSLELSLFNKENNLKILIGILDWVLDQIKAIKA